MVVKTVIFYLHLVRVGFEPASIYVISNIANANRHKNSRQFFDWEYSLQTSITLAKTEIIYPYNVGAKVAMDFT